MWLWTIDKKINLCLNDFLLRKKYVYVYEYLYLIFKVIKSFNLWLWLNGDYEVTMNNWIVSSRKKMWWKLNETYVVINVWRWSFIWMYILMVNCECGSCCSVNNSSFYRPEFDICLLELGRKFITGGNRKEIYRFSSPLR